MILVKRLIRIGMAARTPKGFAKIFLCKLLGEEMPGLCVNLSLFPPSQARGSEKWGANPPIVKRPHSRNKAGGQKAPKVPDVNCQGSLLLLGMARPHIRLKLPEQDRRILESWLRASKTDRVLAERAQIILACGQGLTATEVAERLSKRLLSVQMWRRRYLEQGVSGLEDRPRSGRPRKLSHANVRAILKATVERIPRESTYWSVRLMAEHSGVSKHQVAQIWKAADLKPHRVRNFKISNDPHFAEKVIDVVGLYMDPPDNALVLSVDEKTEIQALDRTQPMLPLRPGQIQRRTHDYKRHGTASLYAAFDVVTGEVMGRITNRHRAKEFLAFLRQIDQAVEPELDVHLILDNSSTHKTKQVQSWLAQRPRYHLHFTPTSASWLNAVESWFSQLERRSIYRNSFSSVQELRQEIKRYIRVHNQRLAKPFKWRATADSILAKVQNARDSLGHY